MHGVTRNQLETMRAIQILTAQLGRGPYLRELGEVFGLNFHSVHDRLRWLLKKGLVARVGGRRGELRVTYNLTTCPTCGVTHAGEITQEQVESAPRKFGDPDGSDGPADRGTA